MLNWQQLPNDSPTSVNSPMTKSGIDQTNINNHVSPPPLRESNNWHLAVP